MHKPITSFVQLCSQGIQLLHSHVHCDSLACTAQMHCNLMSQSGVGEALQEAAQGAQPGEAHQAARPDQI